MPDNSKPIMNNLLKLHVNYYILYINNKDQSHTLYQQERSIWV